LSESYILLNTSHFEGFSNTYLEAFSVGTPVFAMEKADPDSIIKNNRLGYIYKDVDDLVSIFKNITKITKKSTIQ
jgi:glycosyltransferase involved in cell wall biosynthesis